MTITKLQLEPNTDKEYMEESGIVAFQLVEFSYSFYGSTETDILDTKIMADGRQIVVDGNGFIDAGTEI
jgi:hypothetical protein